MAEADPAIEVDNALELLPEDEARPPRTVEDFAKERGWRPKDEYAGDPDQWRDAETFVAFGLDRNRDLSRDVKTLRETTDRMARTQADIIQQNIDKVRQEERARWESKHRIAVEEGDASSAFEAVEKIAELAQPAPRHPETDPTVQSFISENAWFNADPAAQAVAVTVCDAAARRGASVAEQLKEAREAVHKRFPEYAPAAPKPAAAVAAPASRSGPAAGRKKGFGDLPSDAQQVARTLKARGLVSSVDSYAEQYFSAKGA